MGESKVRVGNMDAPTKPLDVMYSFRALGFSEFAIRISVIAVAIQWACYFATTNRRKKSNQCRVQRAPVTQTGVV